MRHLDRTAPAETLNLGLCLGDAGDVRKQAEEGERAQLRPARSCAQSTEMAMHDADAKGLATGDPSQAAMLAAVTELRTTLHIHVCRRQTDVSPAPGLPARGPPRNLQGYRARSGSHGAGDGLEAGCFEKGGLDDRTDCQGMKRTGFTDVSESPTPRPSMPSPVDQSQF